MHNRNELCGSWLSLLLSFSRLWCSKNWKIGSLKYFCLQLCFCYGCLYRNPVFKETAPKNQMLWHLSFKLFRREGKKFIFTSVSNFFQKYFYLQIVYSYLVLFKKSRRKQWVVASYKAAVDSCLCFPAGVGVHLESMKFLSLFLISCSIQDCTAAFWKLFLSVSSSELCVLKHLARS